MIQNERFTKQPAYGRPILKQRIHPRIRMRSRRRRRAIDSIATWSRAHEHPTHAIRLPAIERLQVAMIECILPQYGNDSLDNLLVRNRSGRFHTFAGVAWG